MGAPSTHHRRKNLWFTLLFAGLLAVLNPLLINLIVEQILPGVIPGMAMPLIWEVFYIPMIALDLCLVGMVGFSLLTRGHLAHSSRFKACIWAGVGFFLLWFYLGGNHFFAGRYAIIRLVVLLLASACWVFAFYHSVVRTENLQTWVKNLLTSLVGILLILLLAEMYSCLWGGRIKTT